MNKTYPKRTPQLPSNTLPPSLLPSNPPPDIPDPLLAVLENRNHAHHQHPKHHLPRTFRLRPHVDQFLF
ncbi:unnamed protein product [Periconia digitata]|uniref:Uncharacterized protein n=1 Tax=Periconia digitata TaxID=1303443 RepID=A0A9W4XSY8_9PLEO|nr:unnamed protein product [Periconia digitata]